MSKRAKTPEVPVRVLLVEEFFVCVITAFTMVSLGFAASQILAWSYVS